MKKYLKKISLLLIVAIAIFSIHKLVVFALELYGSIPRISATIYENSQYSLGGSGVELTESGITIDGWNMDTSKYLQVNPTIPDDENIYVISVSVPKELYFVTNTLTTPSGVSKVEFTKNQDITGADGSVVLPVKPYSGTAYYTISPGVATATIQLEIGFDRVQWNYFGNSPLTPSNINPIEVKLNRKNGENLEEVKTLLVSEARSGSAYSITAYHSYNVDGAISAIPKNAIENETKHSVVKSRIEIWPSNQSGEDMYYEDFKITISVPRVKDATGTYKYLGVNFDTFDFINFHKTPDYTVDKSNLSNGIFVIDLKNAYFFSSTILEFRHIFPSDFDFGTESFYTFTGGKVQYSTKDKTGTYKNLCSRDMFPIKYYCRYEEQVTISSFSASVNNSDISTNTISRLGGIVIENTGVGDSELKKIKVNFDTDNTGYFRVTNINIPASTKHSYLNITYTLVDSDNKLIYFDSSGNIVSKDTAGATPNQTISISNKFYNESPSNNMSIRLNRSDLPSNQNGYSFKSIEYQMIVDGNTMLYGSSGSSSYTSGGNFFGFPKSSVSNSSTMNTNFTLETVSGAYETLSVNISTVATTSNSSAYGLEYPKVNGKTTNISVQAGNSLTLSGTVSMSVYAYGVTTWLKNIVIGLVLPDGISINESGTKFSGKFGTVEPESITSRSLGNGKNLWLVNAPSAINIGYFTENFQAMPHGNYLDFEITLNTSYYMSQQSILLTNSMFVASRKTATENAQLNAAGGAWGWAAVTDTYDINGNGSTTDNIGGIKISNTLSFEITPQNATFDIDDSISVTSNNITSSNSNTASLNTSNDVINYNLYLNCANGGEANNFSYYIPIPKKNYTTDNFLITDVSTAFDTKLNEAVSVEGSDIYNILYTFDTGLNYSTVSANTVQWYTKEEIAALSLNYKNVTMIKLVSKTSVIPNGSRTTLTVKLKYAGTNYEVEAGNTFTWHSAGYYLYTVGGRETEGNFNTNGVTVSLTYSKNLPDVTLTAAPNRTPTISENIVEYITNDTDIPKFANSQEYKLVQAEVYNVELQTKEYIESNPDLAGVYANQTFAITVALNNGAEKNVLTSANTSPVKIGTSSANGNTKFKYNIYNANNISDNSQTRYVILTIRSDKGVTLTQKIIINRELSQAYDPNSAIVEGKRYQTFDDLTESVTISSNSSATAQFVINYIPDLYKNKKIVFNKNLPIGTTIAMINKREGVNPTYWYYKVNSSIDEFSFKDLYKMGSLSYKTYSYLTGNNEVEEIFLIIIDFSNCTETISNTDYGIKLEFESDTSDNFISKELLFTLKEKRTFNLTVNKSNVTFGDEITFNYQTTTPTGTDTYYMGKKFSLVLQAPNNIPLDTYAEYNSNKYYLNSRKQFIIPLTAVTDGSNSINLKIISNIVSTTETTYSWNANLYTTVTSNGKKPMLGTKVKTLNFTTKNIRKLNPSFKVIDMDTRLISVYTLSNNFILSYKYIPDTNTSLSIELQQKVGNGYQKVTDKLNQVNGSSNHNLGIYKLSPSSGDNQLTFKLSTSIPLGSYRFLFRISDASGNTIDEIPYTFIIGE